jgi:hypothetical protein
MIIINFGPHSKDELTIALDEEGASLLVSKVSAMLPVTPKSEIIDCLIYFGRKVNVAKIELRAGISDQLDVKNNGLLLTLSCDALDYAKHQLLVFLEKGYFFPAEFWSFSRPNRKYETQIFFVKFSSTEGAIRTDAK